MNALLTGIGTDQERLRATLKKLFFEVPLYTRIKFDDIYSELFNFNTLSCLTIRSYCPFCNDISIFRVGTTNTVLPSTTSTLLSFKININCTSFSSHVILILLSKIFEEGDEKFFQKIGQYPSLADIQFPQLKKYNKLLKKYSHEYPKALGLAAHGIGIGSFVYLRRVIEFLLEEAHNDAKKQPGWNEQGYPNLKFIDKIILLKEHLPDVLLENKECYSILSKGLHELDEKECLEYFPALKDVIELILDDKLEELRRHNKRIEVNKNLQKIKEQAKK